MPPPINRAGLCSRYYWVAVEELNLSYHQRDLDEMAGFLKYGN